MSKTTKTKAEEAEKFNIRLPGGMRKRIEDVAKSQRESMNSLLVDWISYSLDQSESLRWWPPRMYVDEIKRRARESGVEPEDMLSSVVAAGLREGSPQVLNIAVGPGSTVEGIRSALDAVRDVIPGNTPIFIEHQSKE